MLTEARPRIPVEPRPLPPPRPAPARRIELAVLGWVVVVAGLAVGMHVNASPKLSPLDELQHYDYLVKASRGELVHRGDLVGEEAMQEEACRGVDAPGFVVPPCQSRDLRPEQFQEQGFNTSEIHPPPYYVLTGLAARGLQAVFGVESLLTAARFVGMAWLAAGVIVLWLVMLHLGVPLAARAIALLLGATTPVVLHASSSVNPDATALFAGGIVLLAAMHWERAPGDPKALVGAAFVAVILKMTNVVGVGVAVGYLLVRAVQRRDQARSLATGAAWALAGAAAAGLLWVGLHEVLARADVLANPMNQRFHVTETSPALVASQIWSGLTPVKGAHLAPALGTLGITLVMGVTHWLLLGFGVLVTAGVRAGSRLRALGVSVLVAMLAAGPLFVIVNHLSFSSFFPIPHRYALAALPALAVVFASGLRTAQVQKWVGAFAALAVLVTLARLAA